MDVLWEVWKQGIESSLNNRDVSPPPPPSMPPELQKVDSPVFYLTIFSGGKIELWNWSLETLKIPKYDFFVAFFAALCGSASLSLAKFEVIQLKVGRRRFPTPVE